MQKQTVAKRKTSAVSTEVIDMTADAGKGLEGADKDSYAMPFLVVLQGLSPQIVNGMEGAKPGMFINTITEEVSKEVLIIPCAFQRSFLRWAPRDDGGGFKGSYSPVEVEGGQLEGLHKDDDTGLPMIGDDSLSDTRIHYVLLQNAKGSWKPAVLSLSRTQLKKSKRFMSLIAGIELPHPDDPEATYNPASYSHSYRLTTVKEENNKGSWHGIAIEISDLIADPKLYAEARALSEQVNAGAVKAPDPKTESTEQEGF